MFKNAAVFVIITGVILHFFQQGSLGAIICGLIALASIASIDWVKNWAHNHDRARLAATTMLSLIAVFFTTLGLIYANDKRIKDGISNIAYQEVVNLTNIRPNTKDYTFDYGKLGDLDNLVHQQTLPQQHLALFRIDHLYFVELRSALSVLAEEILMIFRQSLRVTGAKSRA